MEALLPLLPPFLVDLLLPHPLPLVPQLHAPLWKMMMVLGLVALWEPLFAEHALLVMLDTQLANAMLMVLGVLY